MAKKPTPKPKTKRKAPAKPRKGQLGRPSLYTPEHDDAAYKLCLLGATDAQIADFFDVDERTINRWKDDHPSFCQSLKRGKLEADAEIAHSLYHRAKGYSHPETKIATHEGRITDQREFEKHYPPDTGAAAIWLKNRQPDKWRDKIDHEMTGKDGGPIETVDRSDVEIAQRLVYILNSHQLVPPDDKESDK